jgi:hypothetical protein
MFVKNSYASYDNNVVENLTVNNVVENFAASDVIEPSVNYVVGPILLVPENMESVIKQRISTINGLLPSYPNRRTQNSIKYSTFAINDIKKNAIFTLYYTKGFENATHNEKDVFYKYENKTKILEGNQNNRIGNQKNLLENITIDNGIVYFHFNAEMIRNENNIRLLYIHTQWWN